VPDKDPMPPRPRTPRTMTSGPTAAVRLDAERPPGL